MILYALTAAIGVTLVASGLPLLQGSGFRSRFGGREPSLTAGLVARSLGLAKRGTLASRLEAAGLTPDVDSFRLEQFQAGAAGLVAVVAVALVGGAEAGPEALVVAAVCGFAFGFLARDQLLTRKVVARRNEIEATLPTVLDLLTLAVVAGEGIPAALRRAEAAVGGPLGEEMQRTLTKIERGRPTIEALRDLGRRVQVHPLQRMVDALATAMERGAPVAEVLSAQAHDLRVERRTQILSQGGKREVLMLVPVVFLILPVVVVIALYPGLVTLELLAP